MDGGMLGEGTGGVGGWAGPAPPSAPLFLTMSRFSNVERKRTLA